MQFGIRRAGRGAVRFSSGFLRRPRGTTSCFFSPTLSFNRNYFSAIKEFSYSRKFQATPCQISRFLLGLKELLFRSFTKSVKNNQSRVDLAKSEGPSQEECTTILADLKCPIVKVESIYYAVICRRGKPSIM